MGKGDRRSKRGKIFRGTFGKRRPKAKGPPKGAKPAAELARPAVASADPAGRDRVASIKIGLPDGGRSILQRSSGGRRPINYNVVRRGL